MAAIQTHGLTKDYGQGRGIFDLDLTVPEGTIHGFLGPNGAGKTTTIRLLMDFLRPTRGAARVLGMDPRTQGPKLRERVGYVPGDLELPEYLTGRAFLEESARMRSAIDRDWQAQLVRLLDLPLDLKIRTLSKGNKQKVALVDALQHRPRLLILDEPTDGLDPLLRRQVHLLLHQHVAHGGTVFMSSHVVHEIQTTCRDVSIVIGGRLRHQASITALVAAEPTRITARVPDVAQAAARLRQVPRTSQFMRSGNVLQFQTQGPLLETMTALLELRATDVTVRQADLEETFLRLYKEVAA